MEKAEVKELDRNPFHFSSPSSETNCVVLHDWWLFRSELEKGDKSIAVAGFTTKKQGQIIFRSAPIVKRLNTWCVETKDCFNVMIQGLVNEDQMYRNGFSTQECQRFKIGFPINWDMYTEENTPNTSISNNDNSNYSSMLKEIFENTIKMANCKCQDNLEDGTEKTQTDSPIGSTGTRKNVPEKNLKKGGMCIKKGLQKDTRKNVPEKNLKKGGTCIKKGLQKDTRKNVPEKNLKKGGTCIKKGLQKDGDVGTSFPEKVHEKSQSCNKRTVLQLKDKKKEKKEASYANKTPLKCIAYEELPIVSPDVLNCKRTRSGRVSVPTLDKGSQKIVYDQDGNIVGISAISSPSVGSKKRKIV